MAGEADGPADLRYSKCEVDERRFCGAEWGERVPWASRRRPAGGAAWPGWPREMRRRLVLTAADRNWERA